MGRPAFGFGRMMMCILELVGEANELSLPVEKLHEKTGLTKTSIRNYLDELKAKGFIEIVLGDVRGRGFAVSRLIVKKRDGISVSTDDLQNHEALDDKQSLVASRKPEPIPDSAPTRVGNLSPAEPSFFAALLDYDNVLGSARNAGFPISFSRLRELVRKFGKILFAEAFLSPTTNRPEIVAKLDKAGWTVVACPPEAKDKDSVDAHIINRALNYLHLSSLGGVVVISRDRDFINLEHSAADVHKTCAFLNVVVEKENVEGYDEQSGNPLYESGMVDRFGKAIEQIRSSWGGLVAAEEERVRFVGEIIRTIANRYSSDHLGFKQMLWWLWECLKLRWGRIFEREHHLKSAMTAMVNRQVLLRHEGHSYVYYTLNQQDKCVVNSLNGMKV
ncbi:MAG: NYN domain-containing protein [Candidatus Harrisonbacteria bacterium]|nr:NYN domain-containing protein [Candidatus Harrisonbacteria bacterium]